MDRRSLLLSLLGLSAGAALPRGLRAQQAAAGLDGLKPIPLSAAEAVAEGLPRFFAADEFAAFRHLGGLLVPALDGRPGAVEAEAPQFLDFLLGQSPEEAQVLYRNGVRRLGADARKRYQRPFDKLNAEEATPLLTPLRAPWAYEEPTDPYARFLLAAKVAFYQATVNSRAYAATARGRGGAGLGSYWLPVE